MALDADAQALLESMREQDLAPMETLTPAEARARTEEARALSPYEGAEVASLEWRTLGGVPCQIVRPRVPAEGPLPVLVWYHGGGWVIGTAAMSEPTARDLAAAAGCLVVSADYRLAPEHPFPAAYDDAVAVLEAVRKEAADLGGDATRLAVGGDSAGGNLAAAVALDVADLTYQLLAYPVLDATMAEGSYHEVAEGYLLTASMMRWFVDLYLNGADPRDHRVSPRLADEALLRRTCPAHVVTAGYDPLRDEGLAYVERLRQGGVAVTATHYQGQMHGFFTMGDLIPTGARALQEAARALGRALAPADGPVR